MTPEPEVLAADLKALGCEYAPHDPRATAWLDGYRAGMKFAYAEAARIQNEAFAAELGRVRNG